MTVLLRRPATVTKRQRRSNSLPRDDHHSGGLLMQRALALAAAVLWTASSLAADITGAGATFPYPIYAKWADAYRKATGVGLNYQSIGSGGGIKQITAKTVDFGASDAPLKAEDLEKYRLIQLSAVIGGDVMAYNIKGVASGPLPLSGPMIADI